MAGDADRKLQGWRAVRVPALRPGRLRLPRSQRDVRNKLNDFHRLLSASSKSSAVHTAGASSEKREPRISRRTRIKDCRRGAPFASRPCFQGDCGSPRSQRDVRNKLNDFHRWLSASSESSAVNTAGASSDKREPRISRRTRIETSRSVCRSVCAGSKTNAARRYWAPKLAGFDVWWSFLTSASSASSAVNAARSEFNELRCGRKRRKEITSGKIRGGRSLLAPKPVCGSRVDHLFLEF